jgi:hypothetical protein
MVGNWVNLRFEDSTTRGWIAVAMFAVVLCVAFSSTSSAVVQGVQMASSSSMCWASILSSIAIVGMIATFGLDNNNNNTEPPSVSVPEDPSYSFDKWDKRYATGRVELAYKPSATDLEKTERGVAMNKRRIHDFVAVGEVLETHAPVALRDCAERCYLHPKCALMQHNDIAGCVLKSNKIPEQCLPFENPRELCMDHELPGTHTYVFPDKTVVDSTTNKTLGDYSFDSLKKIKEDYKLFLQSNEDMKSAKSKAERNEKINLGFGIFSIALFPFGGLKVFLGELVVMAAEAIAGKITGDQLQKSFNEFIKTRVALANSEYRDFRYGRYDNSVNAYATAAQLALNCSNTLDRSSTFNNQKIG